MAYSPMMQQYLALKDQYDDCILFYRLGDFYELFFDDAELVSKLLDLTLTSKSCGNDTRAPMCGIPYHAGDTYTAKLIEKGYKVAIAEQLSDPSKAGLVERDVIRVVTPGTIIASDLLSEKDNNYLMAIYFDSNIDIAWCDISTGDFCATTIDDFSETKLIETVVRVKPREIITNYDRSKTSKLWEYADHTNNLLISCVNKRLSYDKTAVSMLLSYLRDTQKQDITHLEPLRIVNDTVSMRLDQSTLRNLEITETLFDHTVNGSLIGVLDLCKTAMGSRKLKQWLKEPLIKCDKIQNRLDAVELLIKDPISRNNIRSLLNKIYDLERLMAKISLGTASPKDLISLKQSISVLPDIKTELYNFDSEYFIKLNTMISDLLDIYTLIDKSIIEDNTPFSIREGGLIKPKYSSQLDELNESIKESTEWVSTLEVNERKRLGIKNLKVSSNKVFGYYIEVQKSQISLVPDEYIRKQTTANSERYITQKLKDIENILLNAQNQINDLEYKLFIDIKQQISSKLTEIQQTARALAIVDVICTFAEVSVKNKYCKPSINDEDIISIKQGRHPVIEQTSNKTDFTANDLYMNKSDTSLLLITGPNMAGKSTYMRQLAIITLMSQVGCFVPADEAIIGICDRIYTRIGASDNISMGQSTFYVEMSELAYILNTATSKSLIILDEIGRGTSTLDGLAIAWSVVDKLATSKIRTVFATHYHELTTLENTIEGVKNLNVAVVENDTDIQFTHHIVNGAASKSYGIQVAKLAGVPTDVIYNAKHQLNILEAKESTTSNLTSNKEVENYALIKKIKEIDLLHTTPYDIIKFVEELKTLV